ncbi:hypothetical protein AB6A40_010691 [Gnathostoma spinigerum]|uniref:Tartrate-resistant acid phosphatase type 5 n=1 Tax=Gnathostoma spinigerum TaxID=75299 RepID=A0ABD6EY13_9BILA
MPFYPYTTYGQSSTATFLGDVASMKKTHFQIALGDNFYFTGVTDVYDERFESSFEDVYTADALQTPWYIMAGNHDHFGNVAAQIAYSNHSQRWVFPASYYTVSYRFGKRNTTVDFIIIDTIVLCGNTRDVVNGDLIDLALAESIDNPNNPSDPEAARVQWRWIEEQLSKSRANYLFVAGHYPVYSVSSHGPSDCLLERLQPLLRKYRVSAYLSGHDHTLQHLVEYYIPENVSKKNEATRKIPLHYIVSGMGSRADNSLKHLGSVPPGSLLFKYSNSIYSIFYSIFHFQVFRFSD